MADEQDRLRRREKQALLALLALLLRLKRQELDANAFAVSGMALLNSLYLDAAVIGSGRTVATAGDRETARLEAVAQAGYLARLAQDVLTGRYKPQVQGGSGANALRARSTLYILRATGVANRAWAQAAVEQDGAEVEGLWTLGNAEHCDDCLEEAGQDWRPLSEFTRWPGSGDTACLSRCVCSIELRDGSRGFSNA